VAKSSRPVRLYPLLDVAVDGAKVEDFGSAARPLVEAQRAGVPLVDTWLLPTWIFRDALYELPPEHDPASLLRAIHKPAGVDRAGRARERLLDLKLPDPIRAELALLGEAGGVFLAQSSSTIADPSVAVAAGLGFERAGLFSVELVEKAVLELWSTTVLERVLSYLQKRKLRDLAMAIVLQRLPSVSARGSYVAGDAALVRGSYCLGSPVTDGASAADLLRVGPDGGVLGRRIAAKHKMLVPTAAGVDVNDVDHERETRSSISDAALIELSDIVRKLDPRSREVEFVVDDADQVRVIAVSDTGSEGHPEGGGPLTVWSRTGLGDLLPGVPTPQSACMVEAFSATSLRRALSTLGGDVARGVGLVARVHGRYYLNVSALMQPLGSVPGIAQGALLEHVRGADQAELTRILAISNKKSSLTQLSLAAGRLLLQERKLDDAVTGFERDADQKRRWLAEMDLAILPDDSMTTTLRETYEFVQTTGRLLFQSSVVALAAHLALEGALGRSAPEHATRRAQILVAGVRDLESVKPALALCHVIELLRADPPARERVMRGARSMSELPNGSGQRALEQWLEAFGERGLGEVELAWPRWNEDPARLFALIRGGLGAGAVDPDEKMLRVRVAADGELGELEATLSRIDQTLVRTLISRARALSRLRERMRVWMARTVAMARSVALDVDRRLARLDPTLTPGSVFYLMDDELLSATRRTRADLGAIARMRRATFQRDSEHADPPETFIGMPPKIALLPFDGRHLSGSRASPGVVSGKARLVGARGEGAEKLGPGEILVLRSPDVGLSPLFFYASGVVSDIGSALSHGAVVAREVGIPAVMGVTAATTSIVDGELLRVDGDLGSVERLDR
jgi:pyruvate,water dikinase